MFISLIVPTYNEEKEIKSILYSFHRYFSRRHYIYEVVVVNDGSRDNTLRALHSAKRFMVHLKIIHSGENHGKGWAVKRGMTEAQGDIRLFIDADNSTSIDHLDKALLYLKNGYDVVIGSRGLKNSLIVVQQPLYKEFLGRLGNIWIRLILLRGIRDSQAGFKVFTARAADIIFPRLTLTGWGFDFEVLVIAHVHNLKVKEMPIRWVNNPYSRVTPFAYVRTYGESLKVRWNLWRGLYR